VRGFDIRKQKTERRKDDQSGGDVDAGRVRDMDLYRGRFVLRVIDDGRVD